MSAPFFGGAYIHTVCRCNGSSAHWTGFVRRQTDQLFVLSDLGRAAQLAPAQGGEQALLLGRVPPCAGCSR
eukprot:835107-Prymnesium_polylepis.2